MPITRIANLGLATNFQLTSDGKFSLTGGVDKADDNVVMLIRFMNWFRIHAQDFCLNPYRFYQNTSSYAFKYKDLFRLDALLAGQKYFKFIDFYAVDIPYDPASRKKVSIYIQYRYKNQSAAAQPTTIVSLIN